MPSTSRIDIRLPTEDRQKIEAKAKQHSMSISEYIRFVSLNAEIKVEVKKSE